MYLRLYLNAAFLNDLGQNTQLFVYFHGVLIIIDYLFIQNALGQMMRISYMQRIQFILTVLILFLGFLLS